jgi:hypothetical protein
MELYILLDSCKQEAKGAAKQWQMQVMRGRSMIFLPGFLPARRPVDVGCGESLACPL